VVVLLKQTDRGFFHFYAMMDQKFHEASPKIHGANSLPKFWPFRGLKNKKPTVPFFKIVYN
jgi:hypothetical protein